MPSLLLVESAVAAPNPGPHTLAACTLAGKPLLVAATGARVDLLDEGCNLVQGLPLEDAFPHQADDVKVEAVAVDVSSERIVAVSQQRVAVWARRGSGWRVHSSFRVPHPVIALDFVQGKLAVAGDGLTMWEVDEASALPSWRKIGSISLPREIAMTRLSPSALVLASVTSNSSTVLLHSIQPASASTARENRLRFRSRAAHSVRIRSFGWRPSDDISDSGPVLFTLTVDGVFRGWGSMIDEPSFFSLWSTLNVHSTLPKHLPLTTLYWRTKAMEGRKEGTGGTEDEFVTVFADGSVALTSISNFDSRPPTCLAQATTLLQEAVFSSPSQLSSLRHPFLLPSRSQAGSSFHLVGRSTRCTLVHARATLPLSTSGLAATKRVFRDPPTAPPVSLVSEVRKLVRAVQGDAVLSVGERRLQCWGLGDGEVITETFVAELEPLEGDVGVASWRDGHMIAIAQNDTLRIFEYRTSIGRLRLVASAPIHTTDLHSGPIYTTPLTVFAARTSEDSLTTTLVYVSHSGAVRSFVYHAVSHEVVATNTNTDITSSLPPGAELAFAEPIPPFRGAEQPNTAALLVIDNEGTLYRWCAELDDLESGWRVGPSETGKVGVQTGLTAVQKLAVAPDGTSAIVACSAGAARTLSIWDPKASAFSSGKQYEQELSDPVVGLSWSPDGRILAVGTAAEVQLLCAQRLDDLSGAPSWNCCATVSVANILPAPLSSLAWLSTGLSLAAADHLFFYSSKLDDSQDIHEVAEKKLAPLPLHHPQLLFQAILQGHFDAVIQILANLAAELTDDGHLTPLPPTDAEGRVRREKLTLEAFLTVAGAMSKKIHASGSTRRDVFHALTTSDGRKQQRSHLELTEDALSRLLSATRQQKLAGLSRIEHDHLAILAKTVFETQARKTAIDENGLRFLVSLRSFYLYRSSSTPTDLDSTAATLNGPLVAQRLKYRDMLWAFHSESEELLLEEATQVCGGKLTWERARTLGVPIWLKSQDSFVRTMEAIGRTEFTKPDAEDRDPITASLFYLALKKKHIVQTFWKQATGHAEQRQMLKFLANDFEEQRWKSAALKNAFALMSKQRFLFAAAFFLLGNAPKDAVSVILRQLDDFQLAIAVARAYEGGTDGPVLRFVLEETVIPLAFKQGYRWLASWAFWVLNRRDWAVQVIVTPLSDLAQRLPYKLDDVRSPPREDPALVLLFGQLRSWSLQTVKGAIAVPGKTEYNFVLHISRILCRMGCHVLALNLLRTWRFLPPALPPSSAPHRPSPLQNRRHSLLLSTTKLDLPLPASNLPSRVASPAPPSADEEEAAERERQRQQFREVVKTVKVEAKAPAEFSFDAFGF